MDESDKKVINDVKEYGWHVIKVLEDEEGPPHVFSIGLYHTFRHPEILIIGLDIDLMHKMINGIGEDIKNGICYEAGKEYPDILEGFNCSFREVAKKHYSEYLGYAMWYYKGKEFPVLQCVWPTTTGYFPWDGGYPDDLIGGQPILER